MRTLARLAPAPLPPRVCVVGAGPAGLYACEFLTHAMPDVHVDVLERWPAPFGLVRYGVAPDHPEIKSVATRLATIAAGPRVRFLGNVELGRDVTITELRQHYAACIVAVGADHARHLAVPGAHRPHVHSARTFVSWYNALPSPVGYDALANTFSNASRVVVVGNGNVALDAARLLLRRPDTLVHTDISRSALAVLKAASISAVHVVGRRGPVQAAFTTRELRDLRKTLTNVTFHIHVHDGRVVNQQAVQTLPEPSAASRAELQDRATRRKYALLQELAREDGTSDAGDGRPKSALHLHFQAVPREITDADLRFAPAQLSGPPGAQKARAIDGITEVSLECDTVLVAAGYEAHEIAGLPYARGAVACDPHGRVNGMPGVYATGWARRGAHGIIGTNLVDAEEVVTHLVNDWREGRLTQTDACDLHAQWRREGRRIVDWAAWQTLDAEEQRRGAAVGAPRLKADTVDEMLALTGV